MTSAAGLKVAEPGTIYLSGFGDEAAARHLHSPTGIMISSFCKGEPDRAATLKHNPDHSFIAGFTLQTHEMRLACDGKLVRSGEMPLGSVHFSPPASKMESESVGPWELLFFMLPLKIIAQIGEAAEITCALPELGFSNEHGKTFPRLMSLAREAQREFLVPGPFSQLRADLIGQSLIVEMLLNHSTWSSNLASTFRGAARGGLSPQQLRRAQAIMDSELERNLTLNELAQAVGCSPTHFSRAFKQSTGIAPFAWLLHRRVDRAKTLLQVPNASIAEVALAVGFSAQPQFTTAFRRVTGQTPAAWRRSTLQ